jgi:type I restriction enzyme S subunit
MVPSGWRATTLGDLVTGSAFGPRFSSDLYSENGEIGTIRTTDLCNEGIINYQTIPYANLDVEDFSSHILESGDLLITRSGTCGIPCIFEEQEKPIIAGAFLIRFKLKNDVAPSYLHSLLKYNVTQHHISKMASGGVQKNLTGTSLKKLKLHVPEYNEQRKIAKILSTWDKAISTTERLIDNSKQQNKALMQQLLTGKKRLLDSSGKPYSKTWVTKKLSEVFNFSTGKSKSKFIDPSGENYIIDMGSVSRVGKLISTKKTKLEYDYLVKGQLVMPKDDIGGGQIIGRTGYIDEDNTYILSDHVYCLTPKSENSLFMSYLINSSAVNKQLRRKANGTAQLGLGKKDVEKQVVKIPSQIDEQNKIASVLTNAVKEIELLEKQLDDLKQEKKAQMQQLLTGKRRVKIDEEAA